MIFVLLAIPIVLIAALLRLYRIPARLRRGQMRLHRDRAGLTALTVAAYAALLAYTLAMLVSVANTFLIATIEDIAVLDLIAWWGAYPLVYVAAEWIFFYGLVKTDGRKF